MRLTDTGEVRQRQGMAHGQGLLTGPGQSEQRKAEQAREKEEAEKVRLDISEAVQEMLQKQAEANREAAENAEDRTADLGKVMEIARRIARGDQVPPVDEKKLMEYSTELYQMAKSAAMLSRLKKRRKHKALFDEEKKNSLEEKARELSGEESGGAGSGVPAEAAGGNAEDGTAAEGS